MVDAAPSDVLGADYHRLFVGPGTMLAPPWESVHPSDEGLTFQDETLQVRQAYAEFGLTAPAVNREPDDGALPRVRVPARGDGRGTREAVPPVG